MAVAIFFNGVLGSTATNTSVVAMVPSPMERARRATVTMLQPGWDRHVEEINGRAPGYTMLCDMPGAPPCDTGNVQAGEAGFSGFGRLSALGGRTNGGFCDEHRQLVDQLDTLLAEADRVGANTPAVQQARNYVARFDPPTLQWPILPSTCTKETAQARVLVSALNAAIQGAGGNPGVSLEVPGAGPSDIQGTIKTVAIAGAIIAGVFVVAPIVWKLVRR